MEKRDVLNLIFFVVDSDHTIVTLFDGTLSTSCDMKLKNVRIIEWERDVGEL